MELSITDVSAAYGNAVVLFGVSLDVPSGSLSCLLGRNGVGKTTLLNCIAGVHRLSSGSIHIDGKDTSSMDAAQRALSGIGYVAQGHQTFPQMSVRDNLAVVAQRSGARRVEAGVINEMVDLFPVLGKFMDRPAGLLSGGQAQQLAIARALLTRPKLLILDEPTEGIQPSVIEEIEDTIARLHRETSMTMLLVEQYVEFAMRLADRWALMDGGRITSSGSRQEATEQDFIDLIAV